jgi:hypothetical protein
MMDVTVTVPHSQSHTEQFDGFCKVGGRCASDSEIGRLREGPEFIQF